MAEDYYRASAHEYPKTWVFLAKTREDGYFDWCIAYTKARGFNVAVYGIDSLEGRLFKHKCRWWLEAIPEDAYIKFKIDGVEGVATNHSEVPF